jgi:excisionase family DNA binding protein
VSSAPTPSRLLRPSQLARFWELHPATVNQWIVQGRLPAIRSPGNHFRVRIADARAFCEREGLPVPPFVAPPPDRVVVLTASAAVKRTLVKGLKGVVSVEAFANPFEAVVAVASTPTAVLALDLIGMTFDAVAAIRAVKRAPAKPKTRVVVFHVETQSLAAALQGAGADRVLLTSEDEGLVPALKALV